jgi:tetratricopeptide (TPR) repeat protein
MNAGRILYDLGVCLKHLQRDSEAEAAWDKALQYDADSARAAALQLAEVRLAGANPASALECFERAVRDLSAPAGYRNTLIDLVEARGFLERGCRFYCKSGDYERSVKVARLLSRLCEAGAEQALIGQATDDWAHGCLARARESGNPNADGLLAEAKQHFAEAAVAYEAAARIVRGQPEEAITLRRSADCYAQAEKLTDAGKILERLLPLETAPARLGETWFALGEIRRKGNDEAGAQAAYFKCIEHDSPYAFRARLQLAQADIRAGKVEEAEAALKQNVDLMRGAPDDEVYQKTLLTLGDLLVRRGNFRQAALYLQEALDRYPSNPESTAARLQVGDCYRQLAFQEDQKIRSGAYVTEDAQAHYREQRRLWMKMAAAHFQKLTDDLLPNSAEAVLKEPDEQQFRRAAFAAAECQFELGDYAGAARQYEALAARYAGHLEVLEALKQIARCNWVQGDGKKAAAAVKRLQAALAQLPDASFGVESGAATRKDWQAWLEWASHQ